MTENEARKNLCPVQTTPQFKSVMCTASACMAWRTRREFLDKYSGADSNQAPEWVTFAPYGFAAEDGETRLNGFCGLAGVPI